MATKVEIQATRQARQVRDSLARELVTMREDAGLSQRRLARIASVSQSHLSKIEAGAAEATLAVYARLAVGLGGDLAVRIYPGTGPSVRDRHQVRIVEHIVRVRASRWRATPEVAVWKPIRGWIDLVLADVATGCLLAVEVESSLRRVEQLLRWTQAKAAALPSARDWPFGAPPDQVTVSRLLVVRATRSNRQAVALAAESLRASHPGDRQQALEALVGDGRWPGHSLLWARTDDQGVSLVPDSPGRATRV